MGFELLPGKLSRIPTSKPVGICASYFSPGYYAFCPEHDQAVHSSAAHGCLGCGNSVANLIAAAAATYAVVVAYEELDLLTVR